MFTFSGKTTSINQRTTAR